MTRKHSNKPVWLLDIDGVINAPTYPGRKPPHYVWPKEPWVDFTATANGSDFRICVAQPVVDFVRAVAESDRIDIRYHTTWQTDSWEISDKLGWPRFPVQDAPEFQTLMNEGWWKLPAVWRVVSGEHRRVLWTDDDISRNLTNDQRHRLAISGCHTISPRCELGLTPKHMDEIKMFLGIR